MPYIEGSKMDCIVNDGLYHRFLKWRLKCENILDCELAMLPESKKCKKVIAWSGDFGMDQYVSGAFTQKIFAWILYGPCMKIFASYKQMMSEPDLTCLQALDKETNQLMSATMLYNHKCLLPKYPPETASILHQNIFWFFLKCEDNVSKTINECSVDLKKFLASRFRQLAKKMGASKATAHHIKQVASDPQVAQINLIRHQKNGPPTKQEQEEK